VERDVFLYRAYLAQNKFRVVLDEISGASPDAVQPLKLLAEYLSRPSARFEIYPIQISHSIKTKKKHCAGWKSSTG
jgi:Coatomer epsilon subunit